VAFADATVTMSFRNNYPKIENATIKKKKKKFKRLLFKLLKKKINKKKQNFIEKKRE